SDLLLEALKSAPGLSASEQCRAGTSDTQKRPSVDRLACHHPWRHTVPGNRTAPLPASAMPTHLLEALKAFQMHSHRTVNVCCRVFCRDRRAPGRRETSLYMDVRLCVSRQNTRQRTLHRVGPPFFMCFKSISEE